MNQREMNQSLKKRRILNVNPELVLQTKRCPPDYLYTQTAGINHNSVDSVSLCCLSSLGLVTQTLSVIKRYLVRSFNSVESTHLFRTPFVNGLS